MTATILSSLARLSDRWLNRTFPARVKAIEALTVSTGFSHDMITQALDVAFEELTLSHLHLYIQEESLPLNFRRGHTIWHILPSNVFTAWLPGVYVSLLLGANVWLKPSTLEPVFAPLWLESLKGVDAALAEQVRIMPWDPSRATEVQQVLAYGSDETLRQIRSQLPPTASLTGFGNKISAAAIFREALTAKDRSTLLDRLMADVQPFRLQGCLSPQTLYIEASAVEELSALDRRVERMPRIQPFEAWEDVEKDLRIHQGQLSCFGYAGSPERIKAYIPALERLGFSRICPLGEMQKPPLSWKNGGISLAQALTESHSLGGSR